MSDGESDKLRSVAYHEAGHAVVCVVLRHAFDYVTIIPDGDSLGRVVTYRRKGAHESLCWGDPRALRWAERDFIVRTAGGIAQEAATGRGAESDSDHQGIIDFVLCGPDGEARSLYAEYQARARRILEAHWDAVEGVAEALLALRRLSAREARNIVRPWLHREST